MDHQNIILYSLRAQGWVYANGQYGTDAAQAREFTEAEAVEYAKRALPHDGPSILLPVNRELLASIRAYR